MFQLWRERPPLRGLSLPGYGESDVQLYEMCNQMCNYKATSR